MLRGTPRSRRNGPRAAPRARVRSYARARGSAAGPRSGRTDRSWRSPSDDPSAPEIGEPLRRVPERLAVDLRVVLAEPRREGERRRVADRRRGQRDGEAGARVPDVDEPRRHQRVADHVRQRVDARDRDARFAQEGLHLRGLEPPDAPAELAVEPCPGARHRSSIERLHDRAIAVLRGAEIHHWQPEHRGGAVGRARQLHEPRARLEDRVVGGLVVVGPEAGDAEPDQVGLDGPERGVVDAELGVAPRALVRGEDVHAEPSDELPEDIAPLGLGEVQRDRFLAAVVRQEIAPHVVLAQHVLADESVRIRTLGVLDADHPRAIAREAIGEERQDRRLLEREDRDALEGRRHRTVRRSTTRTALPCERSSSPSFARRTSGESARRSESSRRIRAPTAGSQPGSASTWIVRRSPPPSPSSTIWYSWLTPGWRSKTVSTWHG